MSASREKKTRQERISSGYVDPKLKKAQEEQAKQRRQNIGIAAAAVVFVLCAAALFLWNSKIIQRNAAAVRVDGQTYTAADLAYFYYEALSKDSRSSEIDTSVPLNKQDSPYDDGTWFDHIARTAADNLAVAARQAAAAKAANFDGGDAIASELSETMESLRTLAASNGISLDRYLQSGYGPLMNEKIFARNYRMVALAAAYGNHYADTLDFSDDEILDVYNSNPDTGDVVDCEYVLVKSGVTSDTAEADQKDMAAKAHTAAETLLARKASGDDLETAAGEIENAVYVHSKYGRYRNADMFNWLFNSARKPGDTTVIDSANNTGAYAIVFNGRTRDDSHPVNIRHILVSSEDEANDLLAQWKSGEATEDSFAKLASEKSTDPGSKDSGGLYENVYLGEMVEPFENWCFDPSRQSGDAGIVKTDYGYHIMYFVSRSEYTYWENVSLTSLKQNAIADWNKTFADAGAAEILSGAKNVLS